jgi:hypothetical protein
VIRRNWFSQGKVSSPDFVAAPLCSLNELNDIKTALMIDDAVSLGRCIPHSLVPDGAIREERTI